VQCEPAFVGVARLFVKWLRELSGFVDDVVLKVNGDWDVEELVTIRLLVDSSTFSSTREEYRLVIGSEGIHVVGADAAGLFYGCCTLEQIIRLRCDAVEDAVLAAKSSLSLALGTISDAPSLPRRGVMLDISRHRIPKLDTLKVLVEKLARLKINQFQLYMEHAFAYSGHEEVWMESG